MTMQPHGENIRKAVKWIAAERLNNPDQPLVRLLEDACQRFDLNPMEAEFLARTIRERKD
jgi:hypothetical protein